MNKKIYYLSWIILALAGCQNAPLPQHQTIQPQLINPPGVLANATYNTQSRGGMYTLSGQRSEDSTVAEIRSLLAQQFIDPITRYIETHRSHATKSTHIPQLEAERQRRCREVDDWYAQKPRTVETLNRLTTGYSYSCPQVVANYSMRLAGMSNVKPHNMPNPPYQPSAGGVATQPSTRSRQLQADDQVAQSPTQPSPIVEPSPPVAKVPVIEQPISKPVVAIEPQPVAKPAVTQPVVEQPQPTLVVQPMPLTKPVAEQPASPPTAAVVKEPQVDEVTVETEPAKKLPDNIFKSSPTTESIATETPAPTPTEVTETTTTAENASNRAAQRASQPLQKDEKTLQELYPWLYEK